MFHQILRVHLFALLEEKEEPDPKEGISKGGAEGPADLQRKPPVPTRFTAWAGTTTTEVRAANWERTRNDHHGAGRKRAAGASDGFRSEREGANPPVFLWLSLCWGKQRAWRGPAGHSQRTRADGNPTVSVSPTVAP